MKIRVEVKALSSALARVKPVANGPLPALTCVLLKATDGELSVTANNLDTLIEIKLPCVTEEAGEGCVSAKRFSDVIACLRGELQISMDKKQKPSCPARSRTRWSRFR